MITDPIGDMIARIRNGYMARRKMVVLPYSGMRLKIARLLVEQRYIVSVDKVGDKPADMRLNLVLRYERRDPAIQKIKNVSRPGLRIYKQAKELRVPLSGRGTALVSTSQGVMTVKEAKAKKLGGEVLLEVW
jgi:small subunit ribosomal protein S8